MFLSKLFGKKNSVPQKLDMNNIPKHIGIIMDGNGRWAKKRGLPRSAGHKQGARTIENITNYCAELGVKVVTAYTFSTENWSRPQEEVDSIMDLLYDYMLKAEETYKKNKIKLCVIGDISRFSDKIQDAIRHAVAITQDGYRIVLNLALNYGGRDEIVRAAKHLSQDVSSGVIKSDEITESLFSEYLDTKGMPEVDLIIRPSGEQRLSNFLLWQSAYTEFWYSDICWPDFTKKDMDSAILAYQNRNRRYGGV